jgi:hypothetical protein
MMMLALLCGLLTPDGLTLASCMTGPARSNYGHAVHEHINFRWAFKPVDATEPCRVFDVDGDWDVDLRDLAIGPVMDCTRHECVLGAYRDLFGCLSGPGVPYINEGCSDWDNDGGDGDGDGDVDLSEVAEFLAAVKP